MGGIPANPSAWITQVAMNLARDALRHRRMAVGKEPAIELHIGQTYATPAVAWETTHEIRDDALRLMFVCCHPSVAPDAQVILALKILCGFGTGEIARAFLSSEAAIEKQLTRTKQRIRDAQIPFELPEGADLAPRLDGVLAAIYLLFNEGYKASAGDRLLREELCKEAVRLLSLLLDHPAGRTPRAHALMALMLFSAARFPTRLSPAGELLRLEDQDRSRWDRTMIGEALRHLAAASDGDALGEYHLQAGIAAEHCLAPDFASTPWRRILELYDALLRLKPSPIVALNRAVAVAHAEGPAAGLAALEAIDGRDRIEGHYLIHAVRGDLLARLDRRTEAVDAFGRAAELAEVGPEQEHLQQRVAALSPAPD
jgi:RNA polymerase sigma-70 factor (ECF subfamily)